MWGEPIPTLAEVLDAVGADLMIYCELKGDRTAELAVQRLRDARWLAAVHAFDHRQVAEARRIAPVLPRGVLETSYHIDPTASMASVDARDLWQYWELIDRPLVEAAHERGGRLVAWTANDADVMKRLTEIGVDALCTDDVALARRILGR